LLWSLPASFSSSFFEISYLPARVQHRLKLDLLLQRLVFFIILSFDHQNSLLFVGKNPTPSVT